MKRNALFEYLSSRFINGLSYSDAVLLCRGIYVFADLLPSSVPPEQLTREGISSSFAYLAQIGRVHVSELTPDESSVFITKEHWLSLIDELFHKKDNSLDINQVKKLISNGS